MSFAPLVNAPVAVQVHLAAAVTMAALGPVALYRRHRDRTHKFLGYAWVSVTGLAALSGFFITSHFFPVAHGFGPVHLLSAMELYWLWTGVSAARRGDFAAHREMMRSLYWFSLGIAGPLTLLPGRRLNAVFFGERENLGLVAIGLVGMAVLGVILLGRRRALRAEDGARR